VADNPDDPTLLAECTVDPSSARHVLFFGDPRTLPAHVAARAAVVTDVPVPATDLSVLVDRHGTTLHPMGTVLRSHLLSWETAEAVDELMAPRGPGVTDGPGRVDPHRRPQGSDLLDPGPVEVRILTGTPRLEGLREELPPNRARRAIELVAYLALHGPDPVTGDRLRTRVLGSGDADATSKTLFNTAHAARRAMGTDGGGDPLFPPATRGGHYRLSAEVSIDAHRAEALCERAGAQSDPEAAVAFYRAALDLVESEPLANVMAGYSWWEAEGHGGRIGAVLVEAACAMASLAAGMGHFALAHHGIDQARLVVPYSEALSCAAMEVAAAAGDADRLRHEWRACQRMIDALDPGASPSPGTERLYGELSRRTTSSSWAIRLPLTSTAPAGPVPSSIPAAAEGSSTRVGP
jgi:DNA-binding SARP family transcriptional activator